jgi:hypothetical protein
MLWVRKLRVNDTYCSVLFCHSRVIITRYNTCFWWIQIFWSTNFIRCLLRTSYLQVEFTFVTLYLNTILTKITRRGFMVDWASISLTFSPFFDFIWLIIYFFTSYSRIFYLHGDVTTAGEGLQNLGLCSALRASEHGDIFIVPNLLWHRIWVFSVSDEESPHLVTSNDNKGILMTYSIPDPHRSPILSPLTTRKAMLRTYSNPDPHSRVLWFWNRKFGSGFTNVYVKIKLKVVAQV